MSPQLTALLAAILWLHTTAVPTGNHTCTGVIKHPVTVLVNVTEPVTFRSYTWCLRVPPRCSKYTVQLKDRVKLHTEMHNKTITVCCRGFVEMENRCVPACPEGADCPFMRCNRTNHCHCTPGYAGLYCNEACPRGLWGKDCKRPCDCPTGYTCHHLTGDCFVDDRPPRRTTTTTTTTKKPTTTTTTPVPTTEGTTLETVKTPVFRFPPPPWVESSSTVVKKTTTREVRKEDAPPTKEMDVVPVTPGVIVQSTTEKGFEEHTLATVPITQSTSKPIERPPILEFLPPLPTEEPTTSREIVTESTKPQLPETVKTTTIKIEEKTTPHKVILETMLPYIEVSTLPATTTKIWELPTETTLVTTSTTTTIAPTTTTTTPTTTTTAPTTITSTTTTEVPTTITTATPSPQTTPAQTTPTTATTPAQLFIPIDINPVTLKTETIQETITPSPPKKQPEFSADHIPVTTQQIKQNTIVTHDTKSIEHNLQEIVTKPIDFVINTPILKVTAPTYVSSSTKSTLKPFILIPFTKPPVENEPIKTIDEVTDKEQTFVKQYLTTDPVIVKTTEHVEDITYEDVNVKEKLYTSTEANPEATTHQQHIPKTVHRTPTFPTTASPTTIYVPKSTLISTPATHQLIDNTTSPVPTTTQEATLATTISTTESTIITIAIPTSTTSRTDDITPPNPTTTVPTTTQTTTTTSAPTTTEETTPITLASTTTTTTATTYPDTTTTAPTTIPTNPTVATTVTTPTTIATTTPITTTTTALTTTTPTLTTTAIPIPNIDMEIIEAAINYDVTKSRITEAPSPTVPIPVIIDELIKELNIHKKSKLEETPNINSAPEKPKKKHEKMKNKNINVKEFPSIHQIKLEKQIEPIQATTEISFKSILHAETYMNKSASTKLPTSNKKQPILDFMNIKHATDEAPLEIPATKAPTPANPNQIWHPFKKQINISEPDLKEQDQFRILEEPSKFSQQSIDATEINKVMESNTIDYQQSSGEPLKKSMSAEEDNNYSLIFNKIKFNMTDSIAAGVMASRNHDSYLHTPMILVLGIALITLFMLTLTLWVYLKRRRDRAEEPFPPCIMAYAMQETTTTDPDSFNHPFFCPTFTNNYGEMINRELRELSYDHPRSSQPEPLYAEIRH